MVVRSDEGLEEPPRPTGREPEGGLVGGRESIRERFGGRQADPPGDDGRHQPQGDEREGDPCRARLRGEDGERGDGRDRDAARHLPVEPGEIEVVDGLCLGGGRPLQQVASRGEHPHQAAHDRVAHQPRLVGEEREPETDVGRRQSHVGAHRPEVAALGDPRPPREESRDHGQRRREDDRGQHERGPRARRDRRDGPGRDERRQRQRCRHRPPQVVDHLPAGDPRHGAAVPVAPGVTRPAEDPWQQLPVAARPAVLARRRDQVVRRELVEQLHVGHQAGAGEHTLEQVVAQERVLGHPVRHRGPEGVDVVDPLAREAPLAEQVLVHVRDSGRVGVDAGRARVASLVDRGILLRGQRRGDPRL